MKEKCFYLTTTGCATADSGINKTKLLLNDLGVRITDIESEATHIIYRPCAFQTSQIEKSLSVIQKFLDDGKCVILVGCVVPLLGWCKGKENVLVCENNDFKKFFLKNFPEDIDKCKKQSISLSNKIKICGGCFGHCTYCMIPKVEKGKVFKSVPKEEIFDWIEILINYGHKSIFLAGDDLTPYGCDLYTDYGLPELLSDIRAKYPDLEIGIANLNIYFAKDWSVSRIAKVVKSVKKGNLHLPIQSGNDNVISSMGREYSIQDFIRLHKIIYSLGGTVGTDVIVGFPGETKKQFEDTLSVIKTYPLEFCQVFVFEELQGTLAAKMPGKISERVKVNRLIKIAYAFMHMNSGKKLLINREWFCIPCLILTGFLFCMMKIL